MVHPQSPSVKMARTVAVVRSQRVSVEQPPEHEIERTDRWRVQGSEQKKAPPVHRSWNETSGRQDPSSSRPSGSR